MPVRLVTRARKYSTKASCLDVQANSWTSHYNQSVLYQPVMSIYNLSSAAKMLKSQNIYFCAEICSRQSQVGKLGREALSPQELASFQDSISSMATCQKDLIAEDSLDSDTVSQLLSQHVQGILGEGNAAESSQSMILLLLWLLLCFMVTEAT